MKRDRAMRKVEASGCPNDKSHGSRRRRILSAQGQLLVLMAMMVLACRQMDGVKAFRCNQRSIWGMRGKNNACAIEHLKQQPYQRNPSQPPFTASLTVLLGAEKPPDEFDEDDDDAWDINEQEDGIQGSVVNGAVVEGESPTLQTLSLQISQTQKQLQTQQQQINQMLQLLLPSKMPTDAGVTSPLPSSSIINGSNKRSGTSPSVTPPASWASPTSSPPLSTSPVTPLRVMVFIDGTWLYYSLFERESRCPINQKFGYGWARRYRFDWAALPRILCQALQDPDGGGWTTEEEARPVEIARMSVFTSFKADTPETSNRYQLFQDMRAAGYDVHQMETVGRSEKCVDIQLAVEMLHYATVPNAYDTAVLLSGDKDFMPALIRVRQKGREVAICSMKSGVNRALYETDGLKDYDMIWLEDYLDELIVPRHDYSKKSDKGATVHPFVMARLVWEFVKASGEPYVSSRDVGRYLKCLHFGDTSFLDEIKVRNNGLKGFLKRCGMFELRDGPERTYFIGLVEPHSDLEIAQNLAALTSEDLAVLKRFQSSLPTDKQTAYFFTYHDELTSGPEKTFVPALEVSQVLPKEVTKVLPKVLTTDYSTYTVPMLKEICRERGLPISGRKAELLERVQNHVKQEIPKVEEVQAPATQGTAEYLSSLIREYLHASGGSANSRDIGRYLAANTRQKLGSREQFSANSLLKAEFGSLNNFVQAYDDLFEVDEDYVDNSDRYGHWAFRVSLKI
eukprot:scaffold456_cov171-Amphora_coffeaeformis.AAC.19